ncbi:MAG: DUF4197 domain-containing protein [Gammaproteobacteria bacterium]|nr:DUF4197 domain-containing protein [Gammaproteobacteria bacterium]MDH3537517.1 DUF4197 domain-containing protein [Gammaproteobacteria bacterium]
MKIVILVFALIALSGCSEKELRQTLETITASAEELPLTNAEVVAALKDSLARGISKGAIIASAQDGYYANPLLKISFPPEVARVDQALRQVGLGGEVDRFVLQLNRAAELAAAKSRPIFIKSITAMTIGDAFEILNGPPDAATRYLMRTTGGELRAQFLPVVRDKLGETRATRYYGDIVNKYNQLPFVSRIDPDLEGYATDRAIEGLFLLVAEEEARIRADPAARATALLRRVFGSLD